MIARINKVYVADVHFETRIEVKSRTDALIGRTVFEAKKDLAREWADVERKMPNYLRNREQETGDPFVGIASVWSVLFDPHGEITRWPPSRTSAVELIRGRSRLGLVSAHWPKRTIAGRIV